MRRSAEMLQRTKKHRYISRYSNPPALYRIASKLKRRFSARKGGPDQKDF